MLCVIALMQGMAQSNLVFFSESGENFTLYVNGERQNAMPASNVKAHGINVEQALIRVQFEQTGIPEMKAPMLVEPGMEMTTVIRKNKNGKYVFRPMSAVPIGETTPIAQPVASTQPAPAQAQPASYTTTSAGTTTTSTASTASTVDVNVSESMTGVNMNVSIQVSDPTTQPMPMETSSTTTTTTTAAPAYVEPQPAAAPAPVADNCSVPMSAADFESAKKAISNKSFAEDRMTVSKQILKANCLSVNQVKAVMGLFSYEESRLEFAKLAYAKTVDKGNYYQVNDAFSFSGSITELDKFLAQQ